MTHIKTLATCGVAAAALLSATLGSDAQPRYRHHARVAAYASSAYGYYGTDNLPGAIVARRTAEAQNEPGLTHELAPDSRQTATGGPVGGVPGFSGY